MLESLTIYKKKNEMNRALGHLLTIYKPIDIFKDIKRFRVNYLAAKR